MNENFKKDDGIEGIDLGVVYLSQISKKEYTGIKPITATHGEIGLYNKHQNGRKIPSLGIRFSNCGDNPPKMEIILIFREALQNFFLLILNTMVENGRLM